MILTLFAGGRSAASAMAVHQDLQEHAGTGNLLTAAITTHRDVPIFIPGEIS